MSSHAINLEALRDFREKEGLSVRQLAKKAGVSFSYLAQIERGEKVPSPVVAKRLADAMGVSMGSFFVRVVHKAEQERAVVA